MLSCCSVWHCMQPSSSEMVLLWTFSLTALTCLAPQLHGIPMDVPAGPAAPQANMVLPNAADASSDESDDDFTDSE